MAKPKPTARRTLRTFRKSGPLIAFGAGMTMLLAIAVPASAQFFPFGGFGGFGRSGPPPGPPRPSAPVQSPFGGFFSPFEPPRPSAPAADYSRAPKAERDNSNAERFVLVLGDAMADWLGYGLDDALSEQPDMGVIRKAKTVSGLIKYQPKGEPADWAAAAKTIVASEKADVIVVMLGLSDRSAIRDLAPKVDPQADKKKGDAKSAASGSKADAAKNGDGKPADAEQQPADDQEAGDAPSIIAPERSVRSSNGTFEFRDDRWVELYNRKIDEMIAVLKTKGVPIIWVGLPAVRGPKATSDMLFLDGLYRDAAAKAGISYVDVWDGFVDEGGRFMQRGPDFEGQPRTLRTPDGVFFTKAGARKLAHYVEREINRLLVNRVVALPSEPATPDTNVRPGVPAPRPLAGPIVPLGAAAADTDALLGGPGTRPATIDPLVARTLVKGEPLPQLAGRADDYAWPHREVGRLDVPKDQPNAKDVPTANAAPEAAPADSGKPTAKPKRPAIVTQNPNNGFFPFFHRPRQQPQVRPPAGSPGPRPPGYIGRAAEVSPGGVVR